MKFTFLPRHVNLCFHKGQAGLMKFNYLVFEEINRRDFQNPTLLPSGGKMKFSSSKLTTAPKPFELYK